MTTHVEFVLSGKLIRNSVPRAFIGGWSCRYPLPSTYQNSRLPEGKQVFNTNHIVCTNSLGTVSHSYHSLEWWELTPNPSFQMPSKDRPWKQAFQKTAVRPAVNSFPYNLKIRRLEYSSNINHICRNNLGIVSHSYQFWEWWESSWNPSSQMPTRGLLC